MTLLDRFRSLPSNKHPDPEVRLAYVESLSIDEREQLVSAAREDESPKVRRAAVGKLMDPSTLGVVARDDADADVRAHAASMLRDIALEAFEETGEADGLAAVDALSDVKVLSHIAKTSTRHAVAERALARIADARTRASVARHATLEPIRRAAFDSLTERGDFVAVAMSASFKDTAVLAVERLSNREDLEEIAARSNNKSAVKRARGILREIDARLAHEAAAEASAMAEAVEHTRQAVAEEQTRAREAVEAEAARREEARARAEAGAAREREERLAAERSAAELEAAGRVMKEAERRRARLVELVNDLESAASDEDLRSAVRRTAVIAREWSDLTSSLAADVEAEVRQRYADANARLRSRDQDAKDAERRARREALAKMHALVRGVEALAAREDLTARAAERALRDVRVALGSMPLLPSRQDYDEVMRRLKAAQAALTPKLQELCEIEGWQRWANVGIQEQLCEKMEALKSATNPDEIAHRVRDLQQQWRQAADVPPAQREALWQRFKAAHDEAWARCQAHFAEDAARRAESLQKKVAFCERAEALSESTHWIQTAEEIKAMQRDWKTIGPVSRGQEKAVWERFRVACDRFFTRRHDDLAQRKTTWADNLAKKDALCVKAEALVESTDWDAAAAEIKRLQAEWKAIGPVKKTRSEAVWQRFRAACDGFFARYAQRHEIARGERLAAREAICVELESLSELSPVAAGPEARTTDRAAADGPPASDTSPDAAVRPEAPSDLAATVRALYGRWQQEVARRGVEPARAAALDQRFDAAFDRVLAAWPQAFANTDLDLDANRRKMEALVARVEKLAASVRSSATADEARSPAQLAAMLRDALAANTIGGKVDQDSRLRAAQEDLRQAQAGWSRIGPVPDPARRPLAERFARASRLIAEAAQTSGSSGVSRPHQSTRPTRPPEPPIS